MSDKLYPSLVTNQESLKEIIDYCLSKKLAFGVHPQDNNWNTEIEIGNLKDAISLGMFLQKNNIIPEGFESEAQPSGKKVIIDENKVTEPFVHETEASPVIEFMMNSNSQTEEKNTVVNESSLMDDDSFASAEDLFEMKEKSKKQETEMLFN